MTPLPAWAARLLRKELRFVAEGMEFDREAAAKLLALLAPRRKNEKQKATQKRKLQGALAARAGTAQLRAKALERADGKCEFCWLPGNEYAPLELHHLEGGSGRRREKQAIHNCIALCRFCHRDWHNLGPETFRSRVLKWAERWGYPLPSIIRKAEASAQLPGRAAR